jgi:hypothetical protein
VVNSRRSAQKSRSEKSELPVEACCLSLLVSLPTMLVALFRYSRGQAFAVLAENKRFVVAMAAGSIAGSVAGGPFLDVEPRVTCAEARG